jgi:hypothetical protein
MKLNLIIAYLLLFTVCCQRSRPVDQPSLSPPPEVVASAAVPDTTSMSRGSETTGSRYAAPSDYDPAVADLIGVKAVEAMTAAPPLAVYFARAETAAGLYFDSEGRPEGFTPRLLPPDRASIALNGLLTPTYYGTSDKMVMCPFATAVFFQFVYSDTKVNVYLLPDCEQIIIKTGDRQRGYRAAKLVELLNNVSL